MKAVPGALRARGWASGVSAVPLQREDVPASGQLDAVVEIEHRARLDRAALRALELRHGETDSAEGAYWLARTAALEHVLEAAIRAVRLEPGLSFLAEAVEAVEGIQAPACRTGDHQIEAAA